MRGGSIPVWALALVLGAPLLALQIASPVPRLDADAVEYYSHLRSLYFDHDLDFANEFAHFGKLERPDEAQPSRADHRQSVSSVGPALLWFPFYVAGDLWARATGSVEDGYSAAHIRSVCLASLVYGVAGLLLVHRVLRRVVAPPPAFWTVFLLLYATFLFWYLTYEPVMSHAGSFFLSALVLCLWWERREDLSPAWAMLLGLAIGLAATVRWRSGLLLLLPAASLPRGLPRGWAETLGKGGLTLAGFAVGALPQLLAWRVTFGSHLLADPSRGRDFLDLHHPFLLETLFSSRHGLLYWTPVLWGALLGYAALLRRDRRTALALLLPLAVMSYVNASSEEGWAGGSLSNPRFDSVLPLLAVGLAVGLASLHAAAARRPGSVLAAGGIVLAVWNLLFMEQYRGNRIPRDDTVSFARVTENSAALLAGLVGSPLAWPANWIFSARHDLPADRYDLMVGNYLFSRQNSLGGMVDIGDDHVDPALLGEGWSAPFACEGQICRAVRGRARLFAPLDVPEALDLTVRAAGSGMLSVSVNGTDVGALPLADGLSSLRLRIPAERWRREPNEVALSVSAGGEAHVDRLVFERLGRAR